MGSQEESRGVDTPIPDSLEQFQARHSRHRDIENQAVKGTRQRRLERSLSTFTFLDIEAEPAEVFCEEKSHIRVIVDD